jgi:penicillin-binding protein 2
VLVENGGFGSAAAAPIARKVMDTYLLDAQGNLKKPLPEGTPRLLPAAPAPAASPVNRAPDEGGSAPPDPNAEPSD